MKSKPVVKSVANGFSALEFIVEKTLEKEGATLAEVAAHLNMQKSTARNLLQTLEHCNYIQRHGFGFYRLGSQCRNLLRASEVNSYLRSAGMPLLQAYSKKFTASAHLSIFFNGKRYTSINLDAHGSPQETALIRDTTENVYRRASARLLLAFGSAGEKERFLAEFGVPSPDVWRAGSEDLDAALTEIRLSGVAVNDHNTVTGLFGAAAAIFDRNGELCAAFSTSLPQTDVTPEFREKIIAAVKETATGLTKLFTGKNFL